MDSKMIQELTEAIQEIGKATEICRSVAGKRCLNVAEQKVRNVRTVLESQE